MHRSFLFVPAHQENLILKAIGSEADTIIFDLEDAVPEGEFKQSARASFQKHVKAAQKQHTVWVRVNGPHSVYFDDDLKAMHPAQPDAILHPKIDCRDDFEIRMAAQYAAGITSLGAALIESPKGVANISDICRSHFLHGVVFGNEDYEAELQCLRPQRSTEMMIARGHIALHAKANEVLAVDTVTINFKDQAHLKEHIDIAVRLGFDGKLCLSPKELRVVNEAFAPSAEEVSDSYRVLALHQAASNAGRSVSQASGKFVGPPMVKRAKWLISKSEGN
ncbi:CoA ester lyase [Sulfitobacter sp.]|uniref:HpcH/HpaI aldolase/citrate lyase family protein n=1 Tax=Sulfitobacter sp. TaxID=1903071 RepID=UPI00262870A7|nr:CoA ester lyase [Sulfitobacter sp.]